MNNRVALIFGANGQDGSILRQILKAKHYSIFSAPRFGSSLNLLNDLQQLFINTKPSEVYYLSAIHGSSSEKINNDYGLIADHILINSSIPSLIPYALSTAKCKSALFYASSSLIYNNQLDLIDENTVPAPSCLYSNAKLFTCLNLRQARSILNQQIVCGHLFTHESPLRANTYLIQRIINYALEISESSSQNRLKKDFGNLDHVVDIMDARDAMRAAQYLIENNFNCDFVIGSGRRTTVREIINIVFDYCNLDYIDFVQDDQSIYPKLCPSRIANIYRLEKAGWSPSYSLKDTIITMVKYKTLSNLSAAFKV